MSNGKETCVIVMLRNKTSEYTSFHTTHILLICFIQNLISYAATSSRTTQTHIEMRQSHLLDAPSLTAAVLAIVRGRLEVLAHVHAHVHEVLEAVLLRNPLRRLAVL